MEIGAEHITIVLDWTLLCLLVGAIEIVCGGTPGKPRSVRP